MQYNNIGIQNNQLQQKYTLKRDSNFVGLVVLSSTVLIQTAFIAILILLSSLGIANPQADVYYGIGSIGFLLAYSVAYIIGIGLPAPIFALVTGRRIRPFAQLDNPGAKSSLSGIAIVLVLLAGMAVFILTNFAATYLMAILNEFGLRPPDMPSYLEKSVTSLVLNIIAFALLPAILEEMVYRGYILKTLRVHGDGFAIIISSLLFALMHGNILQIPFAFIVGIICAFIVVKTGNIWFAVMLHFLNNFMSMMLQYAELYLETQQQSQQMIILVFSLIGLLGLVSLLVLFASGNHLVRPLEAKAQPLSTGQRTGTLLFAPAMIISIILSLLLTVITTQWGGN